MKIFAISDFHLSTMNPKPMNLFGEKWEEHWEKISSSWREEITGEDIVLIPGDISWGKSLEEALPDLALIAGMPGQKIMIRGNHDYWWSSPTKLRDSLDQSIKILQNDSLCIGEYCFCGHRGWLLPRTQTAGKDLRGISLSRKAEEGGIAASIPIDDNTARGGNDRKDFLPFARGVISSQTDEDIKIYKREVFRSRLSLESADRHKRIIMLTHYPPFFERDTELTKTYEEFRVETVVYGHVHSGYENYPDIIHNGIQYFLVSCDALNFKPKLIAG